MSKEIRLAVLISLFVFALLMLMTLSGNVGASPLAQEATATPTATFAPLFEDDLETLLGCPPGQPEGYGTLTPSPGWMVLCASCLPTQTALPTSTPVLNETQVAEMTLTVQPTTTATAAPTMTPTPQSYPTTNRIQCWGGTSGHVCEEDNNYYVRQTITGTFSNGGLAGANLKQHLFPDGFGSAPNRLVTYRISVEIHEQYGTDQNRINSSIRVRRIGNYYTSYFSSSEGLVSDYGTDLTVSQQFEFSFISSTIFTDYLSFDLLSAADWPAWGEYTVILEAWSDVVPVVSTPTPTPTPDAGSYCAVIDTEAEVTETPEIRVGVPQCKVYAGRVIPLSWFGWIGIELDDLVVPSISICVQPITFGRLVMDDVVIDFDLMFYLVIVLILAWLLF